MSVLARRNQVAERWGLLAILLVAAINYYLAFAPRLPDTDASVYLVTAKSLATGLGYCRANLVGCPPETYYPPGFALALAPLVAVLPDWPQNVPWTMLVPTAAALLALPVIYVLLRRLLGSIGLALLITLAVAVNYVGTWFTFVPMSESLYTLVSMLGLVVLLRADDEERAVHYLVLGGLLAGLTFWVRSVGLALLGAAILSLAVKRRRKAVVIVAAAGLPWIAFLLVRTALIAGSPEWSPYRGILINSYLDTFLQKHWQDTTLGQATLVDIVQRVLTNIQGHATGSLSKLLFPTLESPRLIEPLASLGLAWLIPLFGWGVAAFALLGFALRVRRRASVVEWYVLLYLALILLPGWYTFRNIVPILAFVYLYAAWALMWLSRKLRGMRVPGQVVIRAALLPTLFISLSIGSNLLSQVGTNFEGGAAYRRSDALYVEEASFVEICEWIRVETPPAALLASGSSDKLYLCSGRRTPPALSTMPVSLNARDHDAVVQAIYEQADYVVINTTDRPRPLTDSEPLGWNSTYFLHPYVYNDTAHFVLKYETPSEPRLRVYEVRR